MPSISLFSAPKILDLNFFGKVPDTVDLLPTLSKIFPPVKRQDVPPPSLLFYTNAFWKI